MKKKLLYSIFSIILFAGISVANQDTINAMQVVNSTTMPTDEEIMQTISKFNFDKEQQEYLFKETKKRLEDLYYNKNFAPLLEGQNSKALKDAIETNTQNSQTSNEATNLTTDNGYIKIEEVQPAQEAIQKKKTKPKTERVKKYTKHAPLTRGHMRRQPEAK